MLLSVLNKGYYRLTLSNLTRVQKIHLTLRVASAMCFFGHGAFGIITKAIWCNYFGVFGISHDLAYRLMPLVGSIDVVMGCLVLFYPMRIILLWLVIWGAATASLRPLSGEPFAEFIERAGNFGAPLALLLLSKTNRRNIKDWFGRIHSDIAVGPFTLKEVSYCLRVVVFLLLLGHGWLNFIEKKGILSQYAALGFSNPVNIAKTVGLIEIVAAFSVLIRPFRPLLLMLFIWKMGSELFYPHHELFEWIERGGSYGVLLALWFAEKHKPPSFSEQGPDLT